MSESNTHWTVAYPEVVLSLSGLFGWTALGYNLNGLWGASVGLFGALFILVLLETTTRPPEHGPHQ